MKMVPHDAVRKNSHRDASRGVRNSAQERVEVSRLVKQRLSVIAAVENMLHKTVGRNACMSGHAGVQSIRMPPGLGPGSSQKRGQSPFVWARNRDSPRF